MICKGATDTSMSFFRERNQLSTKDVLSYATGSHGMAASEFSVKQIRKFPGTVILKQLFIYYYTY